MVDLRILFLLFIIYSFFGWSVEVLETIILKGKFINRGFLVGPYCPIYGIGGITMYLLLSRYLNDPFTLFIMCILLFSVLEYSTSYIMEKLFKARWWDYTHYKFNINGRICLETMIPFGVIGLTFMYVINPFLLNILNSLPLILVDLFTLIIGLLYMTDIFVSINVITSMKKTAKKIKQDNTEEITKKVKEVLLSKNYIRRRLVKAFPKLKIK